MIYPRCFLSDTALAGAIMLSASAHALTLAEALATVDAPHPDIRNAEADLAIARADQQAAAARRDLTVSFEGIVRQGRQTVGADAWSADNSARIVARKNLYDFSRSEYAISAALDEMSARQDALLDTRDQRRLKIMTRYFDVLLADDQYAADNEFMTVAYVSMDHARDRVQVGQMSRPDFAILEARYQDLREKRNASQTQQRITRALLADALNRPGELASNLEDPKLPDNNVKLPEYEKLLPWVLDHNRLMRAQLQLLAAAQQRLAGLRHENSPSLDAEIAVADYSRTSITRDSLSAGVILTWPLYQGRRVGARVAREQAQFQKLQADADKLHMQIAQSLLETLLEIQQLRESSRPAAQEQIKYRDIALDRSRADYELELKTDLGDGMAQTLAAALRARRVEFRLALTVARLEALAGKPLADIVALTDKQPKG
jgi:outer membrane protein TolC